MVQLGSGGLVDPVDLEHRFAYHAPTGTKGETHEAIRDRCQGLAEFINSWVPEGREKSLAITHLEETMMWANAGIARLPEQPPGPA
jgi:hypothetical protein